MERTTLTTEELLTLKVGDVVRMQRGNAPEVTAPITCIEHRWGTDALPLITREGHDVRWTGGAGEDINFDACREAGAHMVMEIVQRSPYVCRPRSKQNIYREQAERDMARAIEEGRIEHWFNARSGAPKGQLRGTYREMMKPFSHALARLPYEILTSFHEERAMALWAKAGYPGLVRRPDQLSEHELQNGRSLSAVLQTNEHWFVREKQFCRFVRQNWSKLVMTKAEMNRDADEYDQEMYDPYSRDMDDLEREKWGIPVNPMGHDDDYEPMDDPNHPNNNWDEPHLEDNDSDYR